MRLSRITCCTVSALLGSGVAAQANEGLNEHQPKNTDFDEQPDLNFSHPSEKYQVAAAVIPTTASRIVPPETHFSDIEVVRSVSDMKQSKTAAITPERERTIARVNTISPESPEFISEFEWSTTSETDVAVVESVDTEANDIPEQALNPIPKPEEPIILAANSASIETKATRDIVPEKLLFNHNQQLDQEVHARSLPEFKEVEVESEAIAKRLPEVAEPKIIEVTSEPDYLFAQTSQGIDCKPCTPVEPLVLPEVPNSVSPALSISIPTGFGADQNTVFLSSTYQAVTRTDGYSTFHSGIGVGLGNASKTVGVELSYSQDTNDNFGDGGFNAKLHKRFKTDFAGSLGWNGFLNTSRHGYEHSLYGSLTKVFRTRESLDKSFSRVAVTAGLGTNQFRSDAAVRAGNNDINAFGNITVRVAKPVSLITEWSGQDLGVGLSIAPFKSFPLVITPAIRDIFDGNGSRFVLGVGLAKKF
ncbi:hypothetical protein Lepto7376_4076 [[Leptolyngbya] sp. PCC 7376]|uniref:hypothetical protein n=1 Tax=[Leptolyngbya] sp. PCC 7376 TaxID=111781 RepID=UPI00029F104F|nr:hypothetical protein [[Leptolyngbya] sp. PCC 7376]AFY40206.1 hypothetical protein Lepto7376_4076 [[Leptolyngbya] sp. PCC 7376]